MADNLQATPRNELLGLLSDAMYGGINYMKDPRRSQQMQGLAGLLESTGIPQTTQRMAYGEPLTNIGRANVPLLKPETAEAMMNVAPLMPAVGKAGKAVARMAGSEINAAMMGERGGLLGAVTPQPMRLDVYHGTPHTLPPTERNPLGEFDASKIGTGEGAQAYGYGIYTAENPAVAGSYTRTLQGSAATKPDWAYLEIGGKTLDDQTSGMPPSVIGYVAKALKDANGDVNKAIKQFSLDSIGNETNPVVKNVLSVLNKGKDSKVDLNAIPSGNLYKVDLPDEKIATMLDWDKPLSQQPKTIQNWLKDSMNPYRAQLAAKDVGGNEPTGSLIYNRLSELMSEGKKSDVFTNQANFGTKNASQELADAGIAGIRYLDEGSRATTGKQTSNFVVFPNEEKSMTILERNGVRAFPQEATYPQQAALDLAQQRAALPVEQGGLGLPANNTPEMRAQAMGFDTPVYHATDVDFTSINPSVKGKYGAGVYTATTPKYAEIYAQGENARTLPLMARGKLASDDERIAIADQMLEQYQAKEGMDVPLWKKMTKEELANRGYTGVSIGKERLIFNPSDLRSRFAAFDPFRKDVATATAMGVALPDLLAAEPTPEELQRRQSSGLLFP